MGPLLPPSFPPVLLPPQLREAQVLREEAARERARSEAREAQVAAATKALEEGRAAARCKEEELAAQALVRLGGGLTHRREGDGQQVGRSFVAMIELLLADGFRRSCTGSPATARTA